MGLHEQRVSISSTVLELTVELTVLEKEKRIWKNT